MINLGKFWNRKDGILGIHPFLVLSVIQGIIFNHSSPFEKLNYQAKFKGGKSLIYLVIQCMLDQFHKTFSRILANKYSQIKKSSIQLLLR